MKCDKVLSRLSVFLDEMLDEAGSLRISQHLQECAGCRNEFQSLVRLRRRLASLAAITPPDYLRHLVDFRVAVASESWRSRLREAWEYRWSRIRTTERIWFLTRICGSAATFILFLAISASINPMVLGFRAGVEDHRAVLQLLRQQLGVNVLKSLGYVSLEAQKLPVVSREPMINDLYLLNFGQNASKKGRDDTLAVVTVVDRSGAATVQEVLEYPADSSLLADFSSMIASARYRPASQNGRAVDSHLVFSFSKISVYD